MGRLTRVLVALTRWGLGACALLAVLVAQCVGLEDVANPLASGLRAACIKCEFHLPKALTKLLKPSRTPGVPPVQPLLAFSVRNWIPA